MAFGPGARDYRVDKDPLKARREKAKQDRIAARERRERKALGHVNGGNKVKSNINPRAGGHGGVENEPPNTRVRRVVGAGRVSEYEEPEYMSHYDDEGDGYDRDPIAREQDGGYLRGFERVAKPKVGRQGRVKAYNDNSVAGDARSEHGYNNIHDGRGRQTEETSSLPPLKQRHSRKPNSAGNGGHRRLPPIEPQYAY